MNARRPRLLDFMCGAGGAAFGYHQAEFEVVGVDVVDQPNYPFEFHRADALAMRQDRLEKCWHEGTGSQLEGRLKACLGHFDTIHASPPCQAYSGPKSVNGDRGHPALIDEIRSLLNSTNIPFVIENVVQAPLRRDLLLCGEMFGLPVLRHRVFEFLRPGVTQPSHPRHRGRVRGWRHGRYFDGPYLAVYGKGGGKATLNEAREALGVPWMETWEEVVEAIPPAYTKFIGDQLIRQLTGEVMSDAPSLGSL